MIWPGLKLKSLNVLKFQAVKRERLAQASQLVPVGIEAPNDRHTSMCLARLIDGYHANIKFRLFRRSVVNVDVNVLFAIYGS